MSLFNKTFGKLINMYDDITTEQGRNRKQLADEVYNYVRSKGELTFIKIYLNEDHTIKDKFARYTSDGSFIPLYNNRSATDIIVWDSNNKKHYFNFNEHGYANLNAEASYDLMNRLSKLFHTKNWMYHGEWIEEYTGYDMTDSLSYAIGNYGTTGRNNSKYLRIYSLVICNDENWKAFLETQKSIQEEPKLRKV